MPRWTRLSALLFAVCACGDNVPCESAHGGTVALGTGNGVFEPMPPVLPISVMLQAIPYFSIRTRIWGIPPGDPTDELSPGNPATMIHAAVDAVGWTFDGSTSRGYRPAADGDACGGDDISAQVFLTVGDAAPTLVGRQVHFAVTVVGNNGASASTEMTVTVGGIGAP